MNSTSKEIAEWHRKQAKEYDSIAKKHREMADLLGAVVETKQNMTAHPTVITPNITLKQLEDSLQKKGGRIAHLATRLGTSITVIEALLAQPECRFQIGERGFIYPKQ